MEIPAGQFGGPPLPPEQRKAPYPNQRGPVRVGPAVGGFVPGQFIRVYQDGTAMKLPAGTTLVLQMHYTTLRQGVDRSHAHRGQVREGAAGHATALGVAAERHAAHSRRREPTTASTRR